MIERLYDPEYKKKLKKRNNRSRSLCTRVGLYLSKFSSCFSSKENAKIITFVRSKETTLIKDLDLELIIKRIKLLSSHVGIIFGKLGIEADEYS